MDKNSNQIFHLKNKTVEFEVNKSILLCRNSLTNKNLWAKKINDVNFISDIIEDNEKIFVNCMKDDKSGQYLALDKNTGSTAWYIPGRSLLNILYENFLYLIFIDNYDKYFLIKVDKNMGAKIWFHEIDSDLKEYSIRNDKILLKYESGKIDNLSPRTGLKNR